MRPINKTAIAMGVTALLTLYGCGGDIGLATPGKGSGSGTITNNSSGGGGSVSYTHLRAHETM